MRKMTYSMNRNYCDHQSHSQQRLFTGILLCKTVQAVTYNHRFFHCTPHIFLRKQASVIILKKAGANLCFYVRFIVAVGQALIGLSAISTAGFGKHLHGLVNSFNLCP